MTRKGRKNKRCEQGSLEAEEELSDAKRSNMAASEAGENTEMTENSLKNSLKLEKWYWIPSRVVFCQKKF